MRFQSLACSLVLIGLIASANTAEAQSRSKKKTTRTTRTTTRKPAQNPEPARIDTALVTSPIATAAVADERQLFVNAARAAWAFVERNYQASTGLARAHDTYQYVTLWDVASTLAATYSAHELGLIPDGPYSQRMQRALATLGAMDLFDGAAFNKSYDSKTGRMIDRNQRISSKGYGWSTTDIGRLLIWLRIIAVNQPQFAQQTTAIVRRLNIQRLIADGYLQGSDLDPQTGQLRAYPEGRIGYEQYAASGLALWGYRAERALDAKLTPLPVHVLGVSIVADKRGDQR